MNMFFRWVQVMINIGLFYWIVNDSGLEDTETGKTILIVLFMGLLLINVFVLQLAELLRNYQKEQL